MTLPNIIDYDHGISAIDAEYHRPGLAAIHLIVEGSTVALVDTGTYFSVPQYHGATGYPWCTSARGRPQHWRQID